VIPASVWVETRSADLRAELQTRLSALAGPLEVTAAPPPDADGIWRLSLEQEGLTLYVHGGAYEGPRWFDASGHAISYGRTEDGADPYESAEGAQRLDALRARLEGADLGWLGEALQAQWDGDGLRDEALYQVSMGRGRPYGIIRLGFRCNQDCAFCWQSRAWPEPDPATCQGWIDAMAGEGVSNLLLSGGEPTIYGALPELVSHAAGHHGMEVGLETNAIRLRKPAYLADLMDRGLSKALISFHSADPATSDAMTRAPGTWAGTVAGIEAALDAGLLVALNCVIDQDNLAGLEDHARFIVARFASRPEARIHQVIYSHPSSAWDGAGYASRQLPLDALAPTLVAASRLLLEAGLTVSTGGSCGFPPCVVQDEPRLAMPSNPADFDTADLSGRTYAPACDRCAARSQCLGVRSEYFERYGERGLRPLEAV
jgi:organic radical activating enzyme